MHNRYAHNLSNISTHGTLEITYNRCIVHLYFKVPGNYELKGDTERKTRFYRSASVDINDIKNLELQNVQYMSKSTYLTNMQVHQCIIMPLCMTCTALNMSLLSVASKVMFLLKLYNIHVVGANSHHVQK